jgi:hypothetical protein
LAEVCGHIATAPLDRGRPLWEMWVIEGVADTDPCAGGVLAVMTKVHHAAVDGVTGASLLSQLCSVEPDVPAPAPVEGSGSAGPLQIAAGGLVRFAVRPWQLASVLPTTVATIAKTLRRARGGLTMAAPFAGPPTRFVIERVLKGERKRADGPVHLLLREPHDGARVDATTQIRRDLDIGDQSLPHGIDQSLAELVDDLGVASRVCPHLLSSRDLPIPINPNTDRCEHRHLCRSHSNPAAQY